MSRRTRAQVAAGVRALHKEAAGAIRIDVVTPGDVPGLVGAAMAGDKRAGTLASPGGVSEKGRMT